jgi:hypothetical protein
MRSAARTDDRHGESLLNLLVEQALARCQQFKVTIQEQPIKCGILIAGFSRRRACIAHELGQDDASDLLTFT